MIFLLQAQEMIKALIQSSVFVATVDNFSFQGTGDEKDRHL